jgi:membrane-associated phospholipid phosphatase
VAKKADAAKRKSVKAVPKPVSGRRERSAVAASIASRPARHYRAWLFQGYLVGAVVVFVILAVLAKTVAYFTFDIAISRAVQSFHPGWFDALMRVLTWIGFPPQAWILSAIVVVFLFASGLKWETVVATVSLIASSLLVAGIKILVDRPRPDAGLVHVFTQLSTRSFPSGHVVFFTTFIGFLSFLAYVLLKNSWWRTLLLVILGTMVVLVGPSRIYVGQHWASDVFAAYLLGTVWLSLSILVYRWGKPRYFVNQSVATETPNKGH